MKPALRNKLNEVLHTFIDRLFERIPLEHFLHWYSLCCTFDSFVLVKLIFIFMWKRIMYLFYFNKYRHENHPFDNNTGRVFVLAQDCLKYTNKSSGSSSSSGSGRRENQRTPIPTANRPTHADLRQKSWSLAMKEYKCHYFTIRSNQPVWRNTLRCQSLRNREWTNPVQLEMNNFNGKFISCSFG